MHLVFLNQYYPPDAAPTGVMLEAVAEELVRQGHEVTVICAEGGYAGVSGSGKGRVASEKCRAEDPQSTIHDPRPAVRVIRIGATRFGRGTFLGKLADYLSYYLGVAWRLAVLEPKPDRVIALTTPPYLSVVARLFSKLRGGDHGHWVMDLYPDVMMAHGMLQSRGMFYRLLTFLARRGFGGSRCATMVTLGPDMAERVGAHVGPGRKVEWIPLWGGNIVPSDQLAVIRERSGTGEDRCKGFSGGERAVCAGGAQDSGWAEEGREADGVVELRKARGWGDDELVVMYSGNMGLGHRFGEILEVIGQKAGVRGQGSANATAQSTSSTDHRSPPTDHSPRFVFFGGGKRRGEIEAFVKAHPAAKVELHDYAPAEDLAAHLRTADVHLASLAPEWTGTMVPSKLQGIFEVGRPVIFIGSAESSIGRWVRESGGGWVVGPGDVDALKSAIAEAGDPAVRAERGARAAEFAAAHFDRSHNVARIAGLLAAKAVQAP